MKTYEDALQRAKVYYDSTDDAYDKKLLELVFPELKKTTDEEIRKALLDIFISSNKKSWRDIPTEKIIAWLEKQGERKPAEWSNEDKVVLDGIVDAAERHCMLTAYDIEWLKSLKLNKC